MVIMQPETKEKIRLTTREILLTFCDGIAKFEEIVGYEWQRREIQKYWDWREYDKAKFDHALWQLERQGYVKHYRSNKNIIELTKIGQKRAIDYIFKEHIIKPPKRWDKKWRVIIFDIPNSKNYRRDIIRSKLREWGFYQLQKSVFIYPFDCNKEIYALKYVYGLNKSLQYFLVESMDTELDLVDYFYKKGLLKGSDL